VQGTSAVWEVRAGRDIRITCEMAGEVAVLRNVGHHNETLRNP
jgi:hypothetical protein